MSKAQQVFTPKQALTFLVTELQDVLAIHRGKFNQSINQRLNRMMDKVLESTEDEAFKDWMQCNGVRGYVGNMVTGEVLGPYLNACRQALKNGGIPNGEPEMMYDDFLNDMDWWEPRDIVVTEVLPDGGKRGTATVMRVSGLHKLALEWEMIVGEAANQYGLPAMVNITGAEMRQPKKFTIYDCGYQPVDLLEAAQELDCIQGFSSVILNKVSEGDLSIE
ncbi:hypothetical protein QMM96_22605 [Citrobacter freundii]|uniref:hypothetical protein n=1 Tax=Citrobacter freundii TaxID=546 RepID=UPI002B254B46|nr:hypothetical protein [Citrobacter freundii]MEB2478225.1 hypothetical protein [Citrobacter freundii]